MSATTTGYRTWEQRADGSIVCGVGLLDIDADTASAICPNVEVIAGHTVRWGAADRRGRRDGIELVTVEVGAMGHIIENGRAAVPRVVA